MRIYRMSGAGACARALSAEMLGYRREPAPSWLKTSATEGKWHEQRLVSELRGRGLEVKGQQQEVFLKLQNCTVVGHIDGIVIKDGREMLLEIKSMSQYEFERWKRGKFIEFPAYADQITCYMEALGLQQAMYLVKNRSSGYIDEQILEQTPSDPIAIYDRLEAVEESVQKKELYLIEYSPSSLTCRRCFYRNQICVDFDREAIPEATEAELKEAVEQVQYGSALKKSGEAIYDKGKATLGDYLSVVSPSKPMSFKFGVATTSRFKVPAFGDSISSYPRERLEELVPENFLAQVRKTKPAEWRVSVRLEEPEEEEEKE